MKATTQVAKIEKVGKVTPSKFGGRPDRIALTFAAPVGEIWFDAPDVPKTVTPGQTVTLIQAGKGFAIGDVTSAPAPAAPGFASAPPLTPETRTAAKTNEERRKERRLYTYALAKEYAAIFEEVCNQMESYNLKDENLKDISTTIFIQTARHFNL